MLSFVISNYTRAGALQGWPSFSQEPFKLQSSALPFWKLETKQESVWWLSPGWEQRFSNCTQLKKPHFFAFSETHWFSRSGWFLCFILSHPPIDLKDKTIANRCSIGLSFYSITCVSFNKLKRKQRQRKFHWFGIRYLSFVQTDFYFIQL